MYQLGSSLSPHPKESAFSTIIEENRVVSSNEMCINRYRKGRILAQQGLIQECELTNLGTGQISRCKIIPKSVLRSASKKQKMRSELRIQRALSHPNIQRFEHDFEDPQNVYLLYELDQSCSLTEVLKRQGRLSYRETQYYALQCVEGLIYLHAHQIIYRSLKPDNILINKTLGLKLRNFSLAAKVEFHGEQKRHFCGSLDYMAPEMLAGGYHSYEVDAWALGVLIYTLLTGTPPFPCETRLRIFMNSHHFPEDVHIEEDAQNLIYRLFDSDPRQRLALEDVLTQPFFKYSLPQALKTGKTIGTPLSSNFEKVLTKTCKRMCENPTVQKRSANKKVFPYEKLIEQAPEFIRAELSVPVRVTQWRYSLLYGLAYTLSNGCAGILFKDSTGMLFNPQSQQYTYIKREKPHWVTISYSHVDIPQTLLKKVTIFYHYRVLLNAAIACTEVIQDPMSYVKKWWRDKNLMMFQIAERVMDLHYIDLTETCYCINSRKISFIDKHVVVRATDIEYIKASKDSELQAKFEQVKSDIRRLIK